MRGRHVRKTKLRTARETDDNMTRDVKRTKENDDK
jgi:hypothetical protein